MHPLARSSSTIPRAFGIRVLSARRRGSSRPIIVHTDRGPYVTKLRGAAQGVPALVAEMIVAELAEAIELRVPKRVLVTIDDELVCADRDPEVVALLRASHGVNLGLAYLEGARDMTAKAIARIDEATASKIVWLDALIMNPDRRAANPNLLWHRGGVVLIDHGAALGFQHNWKALTEHAPRRPYNVADHLLGHRATQLAELDEALAARLTRDVLRRAIAAVPEDFLPAGRRREAYAAFLWRRLKAPRPFSGRS